MSGPGGLNDSMRMDQVAKDVRTMTMNNSFRHGHAESHGVLMSPSQH